MKLIKEVMSPGGATLRAHLTKASEEEARLLRCLQLLDDPVTRSVNTSTNEAAEF